MAVLRNIKWMGYYGIIEGEFGGEWERMMMMM